MAGQVKIEELARLCQGVHFLGDVDIEKIEGARALCEEVRAMQPVMMIPKPLPEVRGYHTHLLPNKQQFNEVLSSYETIQDYYLSRYEQGSEEEKGEVLKELIKLEDVFTQQVEPYPIEHIDKPLMFKVADEDLKRQVGEWRQREEDKYTKGISSYCNPKVEVLLLPYRISTDSSAKIKKLNWSKVSLFPH